MAKDGLLIGEVSKQSGASRKALRLYEAAGILPAPRRATSAYLALIRRAPGLGFTLDEIKDIVSIKRTGQTPCPAFVTSSAGRPTNSTSGFRT